jgi:hypothetical protein
MNVQEVINISTQRNNKTKEILKKVIENIHKKILFYRTLRTIFDLHVILLILIYLYIYFTA